MNIFILFTASAPTVDSVTGFPSPPIMYARSPLFISRLICAIPFVTNVALVDSRYSIIHPVLVPASMKIKSSSLIIFTAYRAIAFFSSTQSCSFTLTAISSAINWCATAVAPPCTLFNFPISSRAIRSRRMVDSDAPVHSVISATVIVPLFFRASSILLYLSSVSIYMSPYYQIILLFAIQFIYMHYNQFFVQNQSYSFNLGLYYHTFHSKSIIILHFFEVF